MADTTQQLEEDDCITPRQSTTITLQYPSIPVTGTPDSWLSRSLLVSMASNQDEGSVRSNDDTMSSLGDSAYDFIDENSFATTDDEESSLTGRTSSAERIHQPSDNEDLERTISTDSVHPRSSQSSPQVDMRSSLYSSMSDEDTLYQEHPEPRLQPAPDQRVSPSIKFLDIHHGEGAFLLEDASAPQNLAVTVRQHMLDQTLSLEGPYRLLYVGDVAARERIVAKIGAALASTHKDETPQPLRYSVVPMPSSDDPACFSEPVLLDWSRHEIVVYQCISASFGRKDSGHDTIKLSMDGETKVQSFWDGSKFNLTEGWEIPDISIFYLSEGDSVSTKQTRRLARSFVMRHKVPAMVVSEKPAWERPSEAMTIERLTPHICLQTKNDTTPSSGVVKRLPIDLSTLMRLDALQLNQNLAYLALACGTPRTRSEPKHSMKPGDRTNFSKKLNLQPTWEALRSYFGAARSGLSYLPAFFVVAIVYMTCSLIVTQLSPFSVRSIDQGLNLVVNCSSALTPPSSVVATSVVSSDSKSKTSQSLTIPSPAKLVRSQHPLAGKSHTDLTTLLESTPMTINKSEKFQVHVLGDAHIVLRPPHWFTRLRRTPKLNINITQNDRIVKHQLSILFDGVYALELPIDEAHGLINISVWTNSKPKIHENLQADFGKSWFRTVGWKKAMNAVSGPFRQDLDLVQTSLGAIITRSGAEVRSFMKEALGRAEHLKAETQTIGKVSMTRMARTTDRIFASTRDASTGLSRFLKHRKDLAGKGMSVEAEKWRRNISSYVFGKARVARIYAGATPTAYRIQLRNMQKKALRIWWSMTGLPQQRPVTVASKGSSRSCGGRPKKRAFGK
ncbi:MAG: hypothetical protein L6R38_000644 [Xanthoria sp. 2 TBL-2021]|nr:MAG: hypothetical protein L6R38_000644 [Xanthoria sp. 2 TBL-2021]